MHKTKKDSESYQDKYVQILNLVCETSRPHMDVTTPSLRGITGIVFHKPLK